MRTALLDIRVGEAGFGSVRVAAPWAVQVDPGPYAVLYAPVDAPAAISIDHDTTLTLDKGSVVSLVGGQGHSLADSEKSLAALDKQALDVATFEASRAQERDAQTGAELLVAHVPLSANPLPEVMPAVVHVPATEQPLATRLHSTLALATAFRDVPEGAREPLLKRVAEILAIELTEFALANRDPEWHDGLADVRIQRAVGLMRVHPERDWSVARLASEARMSRSGFAARFRAVIGMTPLEYLRHCRVQFAIGLLTSSDLPLYAVADRAGYRSESAFSRVFANATGLSPARYRRRHRAPA